MATNTIVKAQKEVINDAVKELVSAPVFTGTTSYGSSGYSFQGSNYGYASGGQTVNTIDKFPFSADANATDVGDLTVARHSPAGQQY